MKQIRLSFVIFGAVVCTWKPLTAEAVATARAAKAASRRDFGAAASAAAAAVADDSYDLQVVQATATLALGEQDQDVTAAAENAPAANSEFESPAVAVAPEVLSLRQDALEERAVEARERDALQAQEQALEAMQAEQLRLAAQQARLAVQEARAEARERDVTKMARSVALQLRGFQAKQEPRFNVWAATSALATADVAALAPAAVSSVGALSLRSAPTDYHRHVDGSELSTSERLAGLVASMKAPESNSTEGSRPLSERIKWEQTLVEQAVGAGVYIGLMLLATVLYMAWWRHGYPQDPQLPETNPGEWLYPVFDCSADCWRDWMICFAACCCGPARWADTMSNGKVFFMPLWPAVITVVLLEAFSSLTLGFTALLLVVLSVLGRQRVRQSFGMPSGNCGTVTIDCCLYMCCAPCAIAQEARQVDYAKVTFETREPETLVKGST